MPTLTQVYEDHAADCARAAEQTDDPVFCKMLLTLALQWRLDCLADDARQNREFDLGPTFGTRESSFMGWPAPSQRDR